MALPYPKPPFADAVRNRFSPQSDKLAVAYTFSEGAGSDITNMIESAVATDLVALDATQTEVLISTAVSSTILFTREDVGRWLRIDGGPDWIPGWYQIIIFGGATSVWVAGPVGVIDNIIDGEGFVHRTGRHDWTWDGAVVDGAPTWVSGGGVELDGTNYIKGGGNTTGANVNYNRGTIITRFEVTDDAFLFDGGVPVLSYMLNIGGVESAVGRLNVLCSRTEIRVRLGLGTSLEETSIALTGELFANDQVTVILTWGDNLHWIANAIIFRPGDSSYQVYRNIDCGEGAGFITFGATGNNSWVFGTDRQFSVRVPSIWYDFYCIDWRLTPREVEELLVDPALPTRPLIPSTLTPLGATPVCGRPQTDSLYFQIPGANSITPGVPAAQFRIRYGLSPYLIGSSVSAVHTFATTDQFRPIGLTVSSLTPFTKYYYQGEISFDNGVTWYPFPAGKGQAKTLPEAHPRLGLKIGLITDSHMGLQEASDTNPVRLGAVDLQADSTPTLEMRHYQRAGRAAYDIIEYAYTNDLQMIIDGGDSCWNARGTAVSSGWNLGFYNIFKTACYFHVVGNHEETMDYMLNVSDAAFAAGTPRARECRIKYKAFLPNPNNTTYPQGGEDSGTPLEATSDATVWIPNVDWIPAMSTGGDTFQDDFVYETPGAGSHVLRLGAHNSPLQNYYAIPVSDDLLIIVLDPITYCMSQHTYNQDQRWNQDRTLGTEQWAWLEDTLANATQKHKIVMMHNLINGIKGTFLANPNEYAYYARGSGVTIEFGEDEKLMNLLRNNRVTVLFKCHDHGFAHAKVNTLNVITLTTLSAQGKFTADESPGRTLFPLDYGDPAKQGTDQQGIMTQYAQWGWVIMDVRKQVTVTLRQTASDLFDYVAMSSAAAITTLTGRWVSPSITTDKDGNVVTPETPIQVWFACTAENGDFFNDGDNTPIFNFLDFNALNIYDPNNQGFPTNGAEITPVRWESPFSQNKIILNQAPKTKVRVHYTPREVYSAVCNPAIPVAGGCCSCG